MATDGALTPFEEVNLSFDRAAERLKLSHGCREMLRRPWCPGDPRRLVSSSDADRSAGFLWVGVTASATRRCSGGSRPHSPRASGHLWQRGEAGLVRRHLAPRLL